MARAAKIGLGVLLAFVLVAAGAFLVLTRTDTGRNRVRAFALKTLRESVNGRVEIGRIEGNVLGRFSITDIAITDSAGNPFLAAERLTATLDAGGLLSRRITLSDVELVKPVVRLTKVPDAAWNYAQIFRTPDTTAADSSTGFGDWVILDDVTLRQGELVVERPWSPDADYEGTQRDSVIRDALAGESRARVDRAPYGLRQTMDFRAINAVLSKVVVADPASSDVVLQIDSLATLAAPFHPPALDVRRFSGEVRAGSDTISAPSFAILLPQTRAEGSVRYMLNTGDILGALRFDTLALADLRMIYPPLPDSGGGRLDLRLAMRDTGSSEYLVTNADLHVGTAQALGSFGLVMSDSVSSFRDTDLDLRRIPTSLIQHFVPEADFPVAGEFTGHGTVEGPLEAMNVNVDANFHAIRQPPFRFVVRGGLGARGALTANRLLVRLEHVPVSLARALGADVPVGGTVTAVATLSGSTASRIGGPYRITHNENRTISHIEGDGTLAVRDAMRMDIGMRFAPVSLELVEHFVKETDFRGNVTGTGRVRGTPRDFAAWVNLTVPDSGTLEVEGTYAQPRDRVPAYRANITMRGIDLQAIVPSMPLTVLEGTSQFDGRGRDLATLDSRLRADFRILMVDSAEFRNVVAAASSRDGILTVDTLYATSSFASLGARGTLGLVEGRQGTMAYHAELSDLAGLTRWIATGDTGAVAARPLIGARLARIRARADSINRSRQAQENPAAALAAALRDGVDKPSGAVQGVPDIPRDSISGSVLATGEATGSIKRLNVSSAVTTPGLVWGGSLVGAGSVAVKWTDAGTAANAFAAEGGVDSLRVAGFAFDSTRFRGTYKQGEGDAELAVFPGDTAEYRLGARYVLHKDEGEVHLRNMRLRFDSTAWISTRESVVRWRGQGLAIDSLEMRNGEGRGASRIFVNGEFPDGDPGRLEVDIDSIRIAPWLTLLQSDVQADGVASFEGMIEGTRSDPRIDARLTVATPTYQGTAFPEIRTELDYSARALAIDGRLTSRVGNELAHITGTVPIDLSLGDSVETRLLDAPLHVVIEGDSIPLSPLRDFTDVITSLDGRAFGRIVVAGRWKDPQLSGDIGLDLPRVGVAATGMVVRNLSGRLRMSGDTLTIDSLAGQSEGMIRANGRIVLTELTEPKLELTINASEARVLRNEKGSLVANAALRLSGPVNTLNVTGRVTVTHGVIYIPDPARLDLINTHDPAIFAIIDTATARSLDVAPPSEFMRNLHLDVSLDVERGVFARSPDANVEVFGDLIVRIDPSTAGKFAVTGALHTDQGDYTFLGKRFVVTRGSVRFTGEPDPNPVLQVLATYEVRQANRAPLDIRVVIGGTLQRPHVTLESQSQPTLSQSDLIAFLAFGQSSTALLQFAGTGLEAGGQSGSSLAGNVGAVATRQLASVAVGALVDQAKADLSTATRADVLNITPAQIPADFSATDFQTMLRGTEIEIGKYLDRNTFLLGRVRPSLVIPGASLERRIGEQFRVRANFEARIQPEPPSLSAGLTPATINVFGALLRWSIAW